MDETKQDTNVVAAPLGGDAAKVGQPSSLIIAAPSIKDDKSLQPQQPIVIVVPETDSKRDSDKGSSFSDITTSIAAVLNAIAWPLAILIIVLIFRKGISRLISRLKKGKFGGSEWEFETLIKDAESDAPFTASQTPTEIDPAIIALAETQPRGAVISAWLQIERLVDEVMESRGIPTSYPNRRSPLTSIREIERAQILTSDYIALFHDLRVLRNEAAHSRDFDPSPESVLRYLQLSSNLMTALRAANQNPPES
ncbi:MAG: hypothetical protein ABIT37_25165 [Luteolibacter sp.]